MVQYYLNQTMCDVPHKFALALDETDLEVRINGDKMFENVTLISGPIEETTASSTGSSIKVTTFNGEGLKCGSDPRKFHRHRSGQRRVKDRDEVKLQALDGVEPEVEGISSKRSNFLPSAAEPVNDNPEASGASSASASANWELPAKLKLSASLTLSIASFLLHRLH